MLLVLLAGAAIGAVTLFVVGSPFAKDPVTRAQIEHRVSKLPTGKVQLTLCNEIVVPTASGKPPPGPWRAAPQPHRRRRGVRRPPAACSRRTNGAG